VEIFQLTIGEQSASGSYPVRLQSNVGDGVCSFVPPFDDAELARLADGHYAGLTGRAALEQAGADLFQSVFVDEVRALYRQAIVGAKRDGPFRIVLTLKASELHQYPWELMNDGERFLAATGHTQLVRRIGLSAPATRNVSPPLRVLVAVGDAIDVPPDLDIRAEVARIASALDAGDAYVEIQPAMRHLIQERLREEAFDVVHFCGHGGFVDGEGCLCFEKEDSRADFLPATAFAVLVEARSVPVVVLSACESGVSSKKDVFTGVAHALVRSGVPAVVAMRSSLSDVGAIDLVRDFYGALRLDFDVVTAVTEARRALYADRLDWHVPVLYTVHLEREALEKASGARDVPSAPSFQLSLGLRPSVTFQLEFPVPLLFTKRPEQVPLGDALRASSPQVVSLDGPPGSGKTAIAGEMARRAAQQYRGGVLGLDCRTTNTLDAILVGINETLLEPWDAQVDLTQPWGRKALSSALGQRPFLIVLDNFESVLDQGGKELESIVAFLRDLPAPSKALVTSRERLDVGQRVQVRTLEMWPFALLLARAGKRRGIYGFDQDLCDRVELVLGDPSRANEVLADEERRIFHEAHMKLGGLPFAAEIFMGLVAEGESIADLLRDLRPVHERMTDLLDLSFNRLSAGASEMLILMSIFCKPVKRGAVRAVCDSNDWEDSLEELIRASLVSGNKYYLHPLVREYAASKAADMSALREAHVKAGEYFLTEDDADPLAAVDHFYEASECERAVHVTNSVAPKLLSVGLWAEAKARLIKALEAARSMDDRLAVQESLSHLGTVSHALGDVQEGLGYHEAALAIARELGDREAEGRHLGNIGRAHFSLGQTETAEECLRQALQVAREAGDRENEAARLDTLGVVCTRLGRGKEAIRLHGEALEIVQDMGNSKGQSAVLGNLGVALVELGRVREAIPYYEQSLSMAIDLKELGMASRAVNNLGNAYMILGQIDQAIACHQHALSLAEEIGDLPGQTARLLSLGTDYLLSGDLTRAKHEFHRSLIIARRIGDREGEAKALCNLSSAALEAGNTGEAVELVSKALPIAHSTGCPRVEAHCLGVLGKARLRELDLDGAIQFLEGALRISIEVGDLVGEANSWAQLGMAYAAASNLRKGMECCVRAVLTARRIPHPRGEAGHLHGLGLVMRGQGDTQAALACYLVSLQLRSALGDPAANETAASIEVLKQDLGQEEFARLLKRVEPNKEAIVDEILRSQAHGDD
jgi:tetratricopeptide (TPR) repeat protein